MLLKQAVDNFAYRLGFSDNIVAKKKIEDDILVSYATIISRKYTKRDGYVNSLIDSIVVETEEVSSKDKPMALSPERGSLRVSKIKIPQAAIAPQQDCPYTVTSKNGEIQFTYIRTDRIKHRNREVSKFISKIPVVYFTVIDRKIYIFDEAKYIRVTSVFLNPKEIAELKRVNLYDDLNVIIDNDIFRVIKQLMIEEYPEYAPLKKEERDMEPDKNQLGNAAQ